MSKNNISDIQVYVCDVLQRNGTIEKIGDYYRLRGNQHEPQIMQTLRGATVNALLKSGVIRYITTPNAGTIDGYYILID